MAGMTADGKVIRYGTADDHQPLAFGVGAGQQLYYGEVALVSGSGATTVGYLKNAASPGALDLVVGMIDDGAGGTYVQTGSGIVGGSSDGAVWANILTGSFFFQGGSGADALSATTNGKTVYYQGENATGPIAAATGSGTRPVLGIQLPQDPGIAGGFSPGSGYWPVKLTTVGSP